MFKEQYKGWELCSRELAGGGWAGEAEHAGNWMGWGNAETAEEVLAELRAMVDRRTNWSVDYDGYDWTASAQGGVRRESKSAYAQAWGFHSEEEAEDFAAALGDLVKRLDETRKARLTTDNDIDNEGED